MKISKPFLVASIIASQTRLVGASSTTSTTSSTPSTTSSWLDFDYDFVIFWIITAIVIVAVERLVVRGSHHTWSCITRISTSWMSSSTSSATSSAPSTSSTSTQTEYVGIYTVVQERRLKNELDAANKQLELYRGNVATTAENDLRRRLRATEHQVADLQRRIRDHFSSCPAGKRLFCAQYSRCWHLFETCSQFKKTSSLRKLAPCSQCSYNTPKETMFPGMFSSSSTGE